MSSKKQKKSFLLEFSVRLETARKAVGLTQVKAAELAGVSVQSWRDYEGARGEPGVYKLQFLIERKVSIAWLLSGSGEMMGSEVAASPTDPTLLAVSDWLDEISKEDTNERAYFWMKFFEKFPEFRSWSEKKRATGTEGDMGEVEQKISQTGT